MYEFENNYRGGGIGNFRMEGLEVGKDGLHLGCGNRRDEGGSFHGSADAVAHRFVHDLELNVVSWEY